MAIKLTTDLLRADIPYPFNNKSYTVFKKLYNLYQKGNKSVITQILEATSKFPDQPYFLNLAAQYYDTVDNRKEAAIINNEIKEKFPSYLFWRINESMDAYLNNDSQKMLGLLGEELRLEKLAPERKLFHTTEYEAYTRAVMLYYSLVNNLEAATERLEECEELGDKYKFDIETIREVHKVMSLNNLKDRVFNVSAPALPEFECKEIEELFRYDLTIPDEKYESILNLDREALIRDLAKVFKHGTDNYTYYAKKDLPKEKTFFIWHAMFIAKDLEAGELLPVFLNFLKQEEDVVDLYLGDVLGEFGWEIFYALGKDDLRTLTSFFKELPDDFTIRGQIIELLEQIGFHEHERRLEIEAYFRDLLSFVQTVSPNEDVLIDDVTDNLLIAIGEGGFKRLFPDVKKALEEETLQLMFHVRSEEFENVYSQISEEECRKEFSSRKEIYLEYLEGGSEEDDEDDDDFDFNDDDDDDFDNDEDYLQVLDSDDEYEDEENKDESEEPGDEDKSYIDYTETSDTTFVKKEPEVGRNDPCPCGSGKKYKKCHGKS